MNDSDAAERHFTIASEVGIPGPEGFDAYGVISRPAISAYPIFEWC